MATGACAVLFHPLLFHTDAGAAEVVAVGAEAGAGAPAPTPKKDSIRAGLMPAEACALRECALRDHFHATYARK